MGPGEEEVLFPPCSMLVVLKGKRAPPCHESAGSPAAPEEGEEQQLHARRSLPKWPSTARLLPGLGSDARPKAGEQIHSAELQGRVGRLPSHQRHAFLHLMQPRFGPNTRRGPMIRTHALVLADILRPTGRSDCSTLYVPPLVPGMTSSTFPPTTLSPSSFLASSRRAE